MLNLNQLKWSLLVRHAVNGDKLLIALLLNNMNFVTIAQNCCKVDTKLWV